MMINLHYNTYKIVIQDDPVYKHGSSDNSFTYTHVYHDDEALTYKASQHAILVYQNNEIYTSAIMYAVGGATGIHPESAVIEKDDLYICCADKVFSLKLPSLDLNWVTSVDPATCFAIYKADGGLFTHGEVLVSRLNPSNGDIVWQQGLSDILINMDGKDCFKLYDNYIQIRDFDSREHKLDFDGNLID